MKAMLAGFLAIFIIAVCANLILDQIGFSAQKQTTGDAVRLSSN